MAAELVETNQIWARLAAAIRPEWAETAGSHLVKYSYGDPLVGRRAGAGDGGRAGHAVRTADVPARPVPFARVDPAEARTMFLEHGLAEASGSTRAASTTCSRPQNEELLAQIEAAEARMRRGLLTEHDPLLASTTTGWASEVTSGPRFNRWWKAARRTDPELLHGRSRRPRRARSGSTRGRPTNPNRWALDGIELRVLPPRPRCGRRRRDGPRAGPAAQPATAGALRLAGARTTGAAGHCMIRSFPKSLRQAVSPVAPCAGEFLARHGPERRTSAHRSSPPI